MEHLIISQLLFQFRIRNHTFEKLQTFYAVRGGSFTRKFLEIFPISKCYFFSNMKLTDNEYN